jgi:hypothetical protein
MNEGTLLEIRQLIRSTADPAPVRESAESRDHMSDMAAEAALRHFVPRRRIWRSFLNRLFQSR